MRRGLAVLLAMVSCSAFGCTVRARRPDGPYREALELVDALSDEAVACTRQYAPKGNGQVVIAADLAQAGQAPSVQDAGSSAGSNPVIACVRQRAAEKLHNPRTAPARFARIVVPLPLVTSEVSYAFQQEVPRSLPTPASAR